MHQQDNRYQTNWGSASQPMSPSKNRSVSLGRVWRQYTTLQKAIITALIVITVFFFSTLGTPAESHQPQQKISHRGGDSRRQHVSIGSPIGDALGNDPRFAGTEDIPALQKAVLQLEDENERLRAAVARARARKNQRQQVKAQLAQEEVENPVAHDDTPEEPFEPDNEPEIKNSVHHEVKKDPPIVDQNFAIDPSARHADMSFASGDLGPKNEKQQAVVNTMKWAWKGYKQYAWGKDEFKPISKTTETWFNLGLTLVDALDTMFLMGMEEEFNEARDWVANEMQLDQDKDVNLFECTIRVLGGLLSSYALSKDEMFKQKAVDLGDRLMYGFKTSSGVPYSDVNIGTHKAHKPKWGPDSSTSEVTTIQLEFRELSRVTGDPKYDQAVTKVMDHVRSLPKKDGLVPIFINANSGKFSGNTITFGARGDSYYEYLLKQWLQTNKSEKKWLDMYVETVAGVEKHLVKKSAPNGYTYIAELISNSPRDKMDHLVCFLPGLLALGTANGLPQSHLDLAKELAATCNHMYTDMATGLAPEIAFFHPEPGGQDMTVKDNDAHNLLRPETVESLFIMHRITKDPIYVEWGWKIYQNFEKWTRIDTGGYSSLRNVKNNPPGFRDKMESFFLGETLKYLFLLFEDSDKPLLVPLDKWVFNTEAHPLPIYKDK